MDWAAIQTGLISATREASGNPSLDVTWRDRSTEWHSAPWEGGAKVEIAFSNMGQIHRDYVTYKNEGGQLRPFVYGARLPVFRFSIETADQDLADSSFAAAHRIRTCFHLPAAHEILQGIGLSVSSMSPVQTVPLVEEGREMSATVWDVTFNASASFEGALIDHFASAEVEVTATDAEGTTVLQETIEIDLP